MNFLIIKRFYLFGADHNQQVKLVFVIGEEPFIHVKHKYKSC